MREKQTEEAELRERLDDLRVKLLDQGLSPSERRRLYDKFLSRVRVGLNAGMIFLILAQATALMEIYRQGTKAQQRIVTVLRAEIVAKLRLNRT